MYNPFFVCTGKIEIREDNVEKLVGIASMLQLDDVVTAGCSFLTKQLHPSNCLGIRAFADVQSCKHLFKRAHSFTMVISVTAIGITF